MRKSKAWMRRDKPDSGIWTRHIEEGRVKDLNKGRRRVRGIETDEGIVCAPLSVVCTYDIIIKGVDVLNTLVLRSHEPQ